MNIKALTPLDKDKPVDKNTYLTGFTPLETIDRQRKDMVSLTGFTLLEVIVSIIILSITIAGLVNVFISGKRWILHSRSRMTAGELGRYFLDSLQMDVKQSEWDGASNDYISTNPLHKRTNEAGSQVTLDRPYTPYYTVDVPPGFDPNSSPMRRVKVNITWTE